MDNTVEKIEEYLESLEEYFFSSLSAATTDLPTIHEAVNRLWVDISRYGPGIPVFAEIHMPSLGDFQVPPPPPPPPPATHLTWLTRPIGWVGKHPWKASGVALGAVGLGLLVGYHVMDSRRQNKYGLRVQSKERRQVVVVLGGDTPYGLPLIRGLEKKGYIVIASVATPEAADAIERKCEGYVRALVLDPNEPAMISVFLRSLASTLSRKFPITAAGDPFASPSAHPYIHSVISLLSLPSTTSKHAPLEHISLQNAYLPYLTATHIVPLQVIQALLPLLRTGPARARDKGKKSIIVCLPAVEARVGLPFSSVQSMSAASTLRGVEILRREINVAALTDKTESMKNIRVVVADIGSLDIGAFSPGTAMSPESIYKAMEDWSPSEKLAYGSAFISVSQGGGNVGQPAGASRWGAFFTVFDTRQRFGQVTRRPTSMKVFVDKLVAEVAGEHYGRSLLGIAVGIKKIRRWLHGERLAIGAGANTYRIASNLPSFVLDTLLNIPHFLIGIRNRLLPVEPFIPPRDAALPPPNPRRALTGGTLSTHGETAVESSSEAADVESNADSVDSSWISLQGENGGGNENSHTET